MPNPGHCRLRQAHFASHVARAPMRSIRRNGFQGARDHGIHFGIADGTRRARARCIGQSIQALFSKAVAPLANRLRRHAQPRRHRLVRRALGTRQHHLCAHRQRLRRLASARPGQQLFPLDVVQHYLRFRHAAHCILPEWLIVQPLRHAISISVQRTYKS